MPRPGGADPEIDGASGQERFQDLYRLARHELAGDRGLLTALSASLALYSVGHAATALAAALLGRDLIQDGSLTSAAPRGLLIAPLYLGLLGTLVKAGGGILLARSEAQLAGAVGRRLRGRIAAIAASRGFHGAPEQALASAVTRIREVESAVSPGPVARLRALAQLAPLALTVILLSPLLAIGGAAVALAFGRLLAFVRGSLRSACDHSQQLLERTQCELDELLRHLDLWRTYGATGRVLAALEDAGQRATTASIRAEGARAGLGGANEVLGALGLLVAVLVSEKVGYGVGGGTVVAVVTVLLMAYRPLRDLGDSGAWLERGELGLRALEGAFDPGAADRMVRFDPGREVPLWSLAPLTLEGFGAAARGPRVHLRVNPGESVAVIGPTGSGKTTLWRALLGLEPSVGRLLYGETELGCAAVGPEARPFAWVPQDAPLVTGTLEQNVALFARGAGSAARALAAVSAVDLARRCGGELLGPGRRMLSGGERRLVSVARALASAQPVLLLDEPTEGLDPAAACEVIEALRGLRGRCTVLAITHRPELAAAMDRAIHIA